MSYDWFKLYSGGILRGSIVAQCSFEEQLCWVKLLAFASECRDRGIIRRAKGIPFERADLAHQIGMPEMVLHSTIEKCVKDENADDARTRIMILEDGSLQIANWEKYQRVKPPPEVQPAQANSLSRKKGRPQDNKDENKYTSGKLGHMVRNK